MKEGLVVRTSATGESQTGIRIGFVGAGKVGFSMGKFFALGGLNVSGYFSRSVQSAREAADFTGSWCFESLGELVAESDAVFITVPDGFPVGFPCLICRVGFSYAASVSLCRVIVAALPSSRASGVLYAATVSRPILAPASQNRGRMLR